MPAMNLVQMIGNLARAVEIKEYGAEEDKAYGRTLIALWRHGKRMAKLAAAMRAAGVDIVDREGACGHDWVGWGEELLHARAWFAFGERPAWAMMAPLLLQRMAEHECDADQFADHPVHMPVRIGEHDPVVRFAKSADVAVRIAQQSCRVQ